LGFENSEEYKDKCEEFASCLNLNLCYKKGSIKLLEDTINESLKNL